MKTLVVLIVALAVGVSAASATTPHSSEAQQPGPGEWVPVLVTLPSGFTNSDSQAISALGGQVRHVFTSSPTISLYLPAAAVKALEALPRFFDVRVDPVMTALEDSVPWGVSKIGADAVWGGAGGAVSTVAGRPAGDGVLVAVIDTGIQANHPDLAANVVGGRNFVQTCIFGNWGCSLNPDAWADDHYHGTHVAGTIAALDNGSGVIGVAPDAGIYAIKVLNANGSGQTSWVAAGIDHAVAIGADIISLSLGGPGDPVLEAAVNNATAAGVLVIAAAGNSGSGADTVGYPAHYDSVVAVAATTSSDARASFSSTGPDVEIAAPGESVNSTSTGSGYRVLSGTSMATPHVSGLAALMMSCNPSMTGAQVRTAINDTAVDLGAAGRDPQFGFGRISAVDAIAAAGCGGENVDETPPNTTITSGPPATTNSTSVQYSFTSTEAGSTFECSLDLAPMSPCTSPVTYTGLGEGEHSFAVRATDASDNVDPTASTDHWIIDLSAPDTTITNSPANPSGTSVSFSFTSEAGSTFTCSLDGGAYAACTSAKAYSGLSGGSHTFNVRATDAVGNTDATPASYTWTVQAPAVVSAHVGDIDGSRTLTSWSRWSATVVVTVHDASHNPVSGATVTLRWTGAASATVTGTTNASGQVTFTRSNLSRFTSSGASITGTVTNVAKSGHTYTSGSNHDVDGGTNGTAITINR